MDERPDGSTPTIIGWVLIVVGLVSVFLFVNAETVTGVTLSIAVGQGSIGLGVLLLSLGYLVRAISFLPARETVPIVQTAPTSSLNQQVCTWCERSVREPLEPCSAVREERLRELAPSVRSEACREQLEKRGFAGA